MNMYEKQHPWLNHPERQCRPHADRDTEAMGGVSGRSQLSITHCVAADWLRREVFSSFVFVVSCQPKTTHNQTLRSKQHLALQYTTSTSSVTITTDSSSPTDAATALSRMNLSAYVGHATIFSWMFTNAFCLAVGLGFVWGLDSGSGWLVVMHTYLYYSLRCHCHTCVHQTQHEDQLWANIGYAPPETTGTKNTSHTWADVHGDQKMQHRDKCRWRTKKLHRQQSHIKY